MWLVLARRCGGPHGGREGARGSVLGVVLSFVLWRVGSLEDVRHGHGVGWRRLSRQRRERCVVVDVVVVGLSLSILWVSLLRWWGGL
jgi:hypothetical protein